MSEDSRDVALLDLDGTVADYDGQLAKDMNLLKSPNEPEFQSWIGKIYPDYIRNRMRLIKSKSDWWENLPVIPLGMKIVNALKKFEYNIHVLTKGPDPKKNPESWTPKAVWAMKNLPDVSITITMDKGLVYGRVLVDDWPEYILRWLKWRKRGTVIMPAKEYNKDFVHPNVLRYDGTNDKELEDVLLKAKLR